MFKDNCPISSLDEDKLNRRNFAESLANAIKSYKNPNCLTISLMGKWGSGKTSIINMVTNYWNNESESENIIIHFDPWYFSNKDNLLFQFFDILSNFNNKEFTDTETLKIKFLKILKISKIQKRK